MKKTSGAEKSRDPLGRSLQVFQFIVESTAPVRLSDIAENCDIPSSTAHRLMSRLVDLNWVEFNALGKTYAVGHGFLALAGRVLSDNPAARIAAPVLQRIRDSFDETTVLGLHLEDSHQLMFTARYGSSNPLQYRIPLFSPLSLVRGATGHSILAFLPPETIDDIILREERTEGLSKAEIKAIRKSLRETRECGYSLTHGTRFAGASGIAVPIRDLRDRIVGNVCMTLPTIRFEELDLDAAVEELRSAATSIGSLLS